MKITQFFNKTKLIQTDTIPESNLLIIHLIILHQIMKNTIITIINNFIQAKDPVLTILTNQIILEPYTRDEQIRQPRNNPTPYNNIFQQENPVLHNLTNQLKCITKSHCHTIYNNMNNKNSTYKHFSIAKCRRNGWIINIIG